jgi:hypothetical protein
VALASNERLVKDVFMALIHEETNEIERAQTRKLELSLKHLGFMKFITIKNYFTPSSPFLRNFPHLCMQE